MGQGEGKTEKSVEKLSRNPLFSTFPPKKYNWEEFPDQEYVITGLPTSGYVSFESPRKVGYFSLLAQIFRLSLPRILEAHPNMNYIV